MIPSMTSLIPDAFDAGADELWKARARGEPTQKADVARIFRTAWQAWNVAHPSESLTDHAINNAKKRASRARNPLFDALAEATGSNPAQMTSTGSKTLATALAEIKEASPDVTPDQITDAALKYKRIHRDWPLTSMALAKHWGECGPEGAGDTRSRKLDPYAPPPANWRELALKRFPGTNVSGTPWEELGISVRADILKTA